ncbi:unnamed protein product [Blepharisma stoltei]|uniref:Uncharacterized protein n=1 Tax=Blepharisma stoltei TaxID=1481888 RepID=A0AAU9JPV1_9CILI|nr:unnamed protein product [Blepharisma stoltei]
MDLLYLNLHCQIPAEFLTSLDLPLVFLSSLILSPFRVIGLNYQLSSSTSQSSLSESLKNLKAWNTKSYKFKTKEQIPRQKFLKIPVFKSYRELLFCISSKKLSTLYAGNFWENNFFWASFKVKCALIALIGGKFIKDPYANTFLFASIFTAYDLFNYRFELITTKMTYEHFHYGQNKLKYANSKYLGYFMQIDNQIKEFNHLISPASENPVVVTKFICWLYSMVAFHNKWENEKMIDLFILHTIFYPLTTAQRRIESQFANPALQPFRYKNILHALEKIYYQEGILDGLYRGFMLNTIYMIPRYYILPPLVYHFSLKNQEKFNAERAQM